MVNVKKQLPTSSQVSVSHWVSLRYFSWFRAVVALLLCIDAFWPGFGFSTSQRHSDVYQGLCIAYVFVTIFLALVFPRVRLPFSWQLVIQVLADIVALSVLMYVEGGIRSGLATLLLVTLAGAGLVGQGRLALFFAACASIAILSEELLQNIRGSNVADDYLQTAYLCIAFFMTAAAARSVGRHVTASEALARQRGIDLNDQIIVSQGVIEEMQDGVLMVAEDGHIRQYNPPAERFLDLAGAAGDVSLTRYSPELYEAYLAWIIGKGPTVVEIKVASNGMNLRARFVPTTSSKRDFLVFLEDLSRLQEAAQQIKLAALGRLTGSIAHEIRNPLSAISHASELMSEERRIETQDRLLRIIRDNSARIGRIVTDVLQLGRRDRTFPEVLDLAGFLERFRDDYVIKESIDSAIISLECPSDLTIYFDVVHLDQILWNLVRNAVRYSRGQPESVRISARFATSPLHVELHVTDDGQGIAEAYRSQIFEPFFTTHSKGTGLGLYLAQELCSANNAKLDLMPGDASSPGAHFRITARSDHDTVPH